MKTPQVDEFDRPVSRPLQVLDYQLAAIRFWQRHRNAPIHASVFDDVVMHFMDTRKVPLHAYLADRLNRAETVFVASPIVDRLYRFSRDFELSVPEKGLQPEDIPCNRGFAWLEHPLYHFEARGRTTSLRVLMWSVEVSGVFVSYFSDAMDPNDEVTDDILREYNAERLKLIEDGGRLPLSHVIPIRWGTDMYHMSSDDFSRPPLMPEDDPEVDAIYQAHLQESTDAMRQIFRFLLALWEFMGDQIPSVRRADRPTRRRMEREHSSLSEVKVVDLRTVQRHSDPNPDPEEVMWSHRWRVREHKRRWIDRNGNHRETTISSYVKGPEWLPLVEKDVVYSVRR